MLFLAKGSQRAGHVRYTQNWLIGMEISAPVASVVLAEGTHHLIASTCLCCMACTEVQTSRHEVLSLET